jgi:hypothetical protein
MIAALGFEMVKELTHPFRREVLDDEPGDPPMAVSRDKGEE